jgi:ubiquinone/menaquinone biosynthesis C-methylase UbiE
MTETSRHDAWKSGDHYERYMGRWSRQIATHFLDWLAPPEGAEWLEVGCGTGALSGAILARCHPKSLIGIDPSEGFLSVARANVTDARASFRVGDAQALDADDASADVIASALVLNFVPDRGKALSEMKRVVRPGGTIGFYVWDYACGGVEFMRAFWNAATALDPGARELTEDRRFPFCTQAGLTELANRAGLASVQSTSIEVPTIFAGFDDYWQPFTLGAGPAPGYCMSLSPDARERLRQSLHETLARGNDGSIPLKTRAWAVKATTT